MLVEAALLVLLAAVALLGLLRAAATWKFDYWRKRSVPHLIPQPWTGNIGQVFAGKQQIHQALAEAYDAFPEEKVVGFWTLNQPALLVRDLQIAKHILAKDFNSFVNRGFHPDMEVEAQGARAMFALRDGAWRTVRSKLSPVFTSGKMKLMFPLIAECGEDLVDVIGKESGVQEVDVSDLSSRLFIDIITSCAFGCVGRALADPAGSVVYRILNGILSLNWKQGFGAFCMYFGPRWVYTLLCRTGFGFYDKKKLELTSGLVEAELERREVHGKTRADLFGLSMQLRDQERVAGVPRDQSVFEGHYFTAIALQFLLAGSETSSQTMTFTLYELAVQPDLQTLLRDHIRRVVNKHGSQISYEAVHDMELLDRALNETMRLYPVLPFLDRVCGTDYIIPGTNVTIEKNTKVFVPIASFQRDPKYFSDPERYDPDRWTQEAGDLNVKEAFMAFGAGPRYCIGNRFAMDSMKVGLCHILLRYEVLPSTDALRAGLVFNRKSQNLNLARPLRLVLRPVQPN